VLVITYLGLENATIVVVEYDEKLLHLLMEVNKLMLTNVEEIEECQFQVQVNVEDLFHTMTTNANIYKQ
jgi:hypothetical protein